MVINLDKVKIAVLLEKADTSYNNNRRSGQYNYREHLDFTASFIANNYNKEVRPSSGRSPVASPRRRAGSAPIQTASRKGKPSLSSGKSQRRLKCRER